MTANEKVRFAFTDGLDGLNLSETDYALVVECMKQALNYVGRLYTQQELGEACLLAAVRTEQQVKEGRL
jgi:hypothetical protein